MDGGKDGEIVSNQNTMTLPDCKKLYLATLAELGEPDNGLLADQDDDWWEDVRKSCEAVLAAPNAEAARKVIIWWYEAEIDYLANRNAREFAHTFRALARGRKPLLRLDKPQHELETGYRRYEAIRKLHAHAFAALCEANRRGRNFDAMVDRLVAGETWEEVTK